jgi:hypothetical protein
MVGRAVAHPAATPEPRVRAFPTRGSSGYGLTNAQHWHHRHPLP